jgi:cobalt-zinc-cadmium resistance protein CzcA
MLNKIIEFSIKNKLIIGLFIIALIGFGSYQFTKLPIDAVPDITNNQVQIITVAPSLGATDIERLVTFPVEQANNNIPGLLEMRSFSRFGLSLVTIVFNDDVDIYWARQQVAERLQQVKDQLPNGMGTISLGPVTTGLGEIYQYVVRPKAGYEKKYDAMQLRTIQDWIVRRQLLGVKGVADVSSFGGNLKQYEIAVEPAHLKAHHLTINDVFGALEKNNQNTGGAYIEKGATVLYIRSEGLIGSMEDIKNINVKTMANGTPLLIKDIAEVSLGSATRYGALCYNDQGEVSGAVVMMLKGGNSSNVIKDVKERVAQIQKTLPEGVVIEPFLDRTKMVNNAIGTVQTNLMEGALIVLFVLILFLGNLRAGFLVASVIPLSMLFAIILMNMFGVIGNLMSLGALDFGLIVDGSVFIVEAVLHGLTHSKHFANTSSISQQQMDDEVSGASKKMARSVVFGQIIILIVYLPTFALQGIEGKMFIPMAQTVAFALLGAFVLSLTYVPMMSALMMSKKLSHKKTFSDRMMDFFERHYQKALEKVLEYKKTIVFSAVGLFIISVGVLSTMGGEFIPALEEGDFAVETRVLNGSNLKTTIASTQKAAHILKERFPEVEKVVTKIGSGEIPTDPMPMDAGDMIVNLKPKKEWTSAKTFDELAEKMTEALKEVPGITVSFQFPVQMRFNELMTGAKQDVVCKIFGENMDTLARYAGMLADLSASVEGTKNLYVEPVKGMPQVVIEYDRAAIAQYGLNISDINRIMNTGLAGQTTGLVYEGEKRFDMVVRLSGDQRKTITDVANLLIPLPQGGQIPLYQLAKVALKESPNQIQREDAKRRIVVGFNVRGRDVQSIVTELQAKVDQQLKLPTGYYVTYGGAFENLNAAKKRLSITVPVSLLLIFLLLFFSFNSVKQGLLIYSAIPLSAIGGIFALALRGMPFSISAGVGFIALFGVAVLNGIVLIAEFNRLKAEGLADVKAIVLKGTKIRLRPVLMTGFVASLGFLPMAVSNGAGAEVQRPLATVVIGGLLIATFLTLFVLPVLYIIFEKGISFKRKSKMAPLLVLGIFISTQVSAQTSITLKAAIDTALKNNLQVKHERLKANYQKKLVGSAAAIPQTMLMGEHGQINSIYSDTRFGIAQSFSFPTVYVHQKSVLKGEWAGSLLNVAVKEAELKRNVSIVFYNLLYLGQKQQLLLRNDSLFSDFLEKAELRFSKGESNVLEKNAAQLQRSQIYLQFMQLTQDMELLSLQFQLLLNSITPYLPDKSEIGTSVFPVMDTAYALGSHPHIKFLEQQKQLSLLNTKLEKAKLLPELSLMYNNMSMKGTGADNKLYNASTRFQSGQIGIGIPLFFGSQKARINAARSNQLIADNNYLSGLQALKAEYHSVLVQYNTHLKTLNYLKNNVMNTVPLIAETANKQFSSGAINYLEWVMLTNQSISIQSEYIETVRSLNETLIQLNYLKAQ